MSESPNVVHSEGASSVQLMDSASSSSPDSLNTSQTLKPPHKVTYVELAMKKQNSSSSKKGTSKGKNTSTSPSPRLNSSTNSSSSPKPFSSSPSQKSTDIKPKPLVKFPQNEPVSLPVHTPIASTVNVKEVAKNYLNVSSTSTEQSGTVPRPTTPNTLVPERVQDIEARSRQDSQHGAVSHHIRNQKVAKMAGTSSVESSEHQRQLSAQTALGKDNDLGKDTAGFSEKSHGGSSLVPAQIDPSTSEAPRQSESGHHVSPRQHNAQQSASGECGHPSQSDDAPDSHSRRLTWIVLEKRKPLRVVQLSNNHNSH
ncbi:hypothetical protein BLNAU_23285 [Blattamonas nauphoetae]|uniref:Uncharacterized protein n=1 Tax=Blattamonas nauphoetae TaxID=2049346 RepID=A0ABQ9WSV3_9EUKA|nr:hypothetical protein BLNAU_23285 [Blattamonas nauphoetae]